jgi:transposase
MELTAVGIDLAKNVFQLHGVDRRGKAVLRKKLSRGQLLAFVVNLPRCRIGMEACSGAHYWAREFGKLGHEVRLISPQFVRPYVKSNKNDAADAEAICEAMLRPNMRFVSPRGIESQDIQSLHRVRSRLVGSRTALVNEIRGLLGEYGVVLAKSVRQVRKNLAESVEKAVGQGQMTAMSRQTFSDLADELRGLDDQIQLYDEKIQAIHRSHPVCQRLSKVPGVGPVTATAVVGSVGDPSAFKNGRQFAAWLGLVPRQHSSGGKERLLGISKRGDVYLRTLLIHGARTVIQWRQADPKDRQGLWLKGLIERRGINRACVALANKNARRMWVLMARNEEYREIA